LGRSPKKLKTLYVKSALEVVFAVAVAQEDLQDGLATRMINSEILPQLRLKSVAIRKRQKRHYKNESKQSQLLQKKNLLLNLFNSNKCVLAVTFVENPPLELAFFINHAPLALISSANLALGRESIKLGKKQNNWRNGVALFATELVIAVVAGSEVLQLGMDN
jgi:hypothetical protein